MAPDPEETDQERHDERELNDPRKLAQETDIARTAEAQNERKDLDPGHHTQ
jgi:hypothetical protein